MINVKCDCLACSQHLTRADLRFENSENFVKILKTSILKKDIVSIQQLMAFAVKNFNRLNIYPEHIRIERMVLEKENILTLHLIVFLLTFPSFLTKLITT